MKRDYYEVLEINEDATADDIKKAYRRLAFKHHPDRNQNKKDSEEKFKEIDAAYKVLKDPKTRHRYDQYKRSSNISDIFNSVFHNTNRSPKTHRGSNVKHVVVLTLEEVAEGSEKLISFTRFNICNQCQGIGGMGVPCSTCKGHGAIRRGFEFLSCPKCYGRKIEIKTPCINCHGQGKITEKRTIAIRIPPSIENEEVIIIRGEGNLENQSRPRGDLRCQVQIQPHSTFIRDGDDLIIDKKLKFTDICLGTQCNVPTIYGKSISLRIPPGTQVDQVFRIPMQGLYRSSGSGDLLVRIKIDVPKNLPDKAIKLLKEFDALLEYNGSEESDVRR